MRHAIKSLTFAVLLLGSGGTASAVTYVFDYATPFLGGSKIPFSVIVADSIWTQGGHVSFHQFNNAYFPTVIASDAGVPYEGVEFGWPEPERSPRPCIPEVERWDGRWSCYVAAEWLDVLETSLSADFRGNLLAGSRLGLAFASGWYQMTGDSDGLWSVTSMHGSYYSGVVCDSAEECGATGRFVRVPEPGTLGLLGFGLLGMGVGRRRKAANAMRWVAILSAVFGGALLINPVPANAESVQWSGNGHWYDVISVPSGTSWTDARNAAADSGGYLATITSPDENAFIFSLVNDDRYWKVYGRDIAGPWLGGSFDGAAWQWLTGEPFVYTNWYPTEPDHLPYPFPQDALEFYGRGDSVTDRTPMWDDNWHSNPAAVAYVVERVPEPTTLALYCLGLVGLGFTRKHKS